jgi:hypothetical protein
MTSNATKNLMTRSLFDVFNQRDSLKRFAAIGEVYSPDIVFYEAEDVVAGPAALHERVQQLLDGAPGFVFTTVGLTAFNHDLGRQAWAFGPPDDIPVAFGTDIARFADGRIQQLYVFVEPPST